MEKKNVKETVLEKNETDNHHDEPAEINYRGWKAMPFVIGKKFVLFLFLFSLS